LGGTITVTGSGATTLDSLTDVVITSASSGQVLKYNGTNWINDTDATGGGGANTFSSFAVAGQSTVVADNSTDTLTLAAGSGIQITTDSGLDVITITNNASIFNTIAVAGQSDVVADTSSDTLTLAAGSGISITTNNTTDTITLTASLAFTGLTDSASLTIDKIYMPAITMLTVTANGSSSYSFDQYTGTNPTIYALNGATIAFNLTVGGSHPFLIQTSGGANYNTGLVHVSTTGTVTTGSGAQGQTSGTLYWKIPNSINGNYRYICSNHGVMTGTITIKDFVSI
jgi:plastocyanin